MGYLSIKYLMFLLNAIYLYQSYFNTDLCNVARPIKNNSQNRVALFLVRDS